MFQFIRSCVQSHTKAFVLISTLFLSACASSTGYTIDTTATSQYYFENLYQDNVHFVVNDLRGEYPEQNQMSNSLYQQLVSGLNTEHRQYSHRYTIYINLTKIYVMFQGVQWQGHAEFQAKVTDENNQIISEWTSVGISNQSTLWGVGSERLAGQEAYNLAVSDLVFKLHHLPLP